MTFLFFLNNNLKSQNENLTTEADKLLNKAYIIMLSNPEKALNYASKALEITKEMGDSARMAWSLNNIGHAYMLLGDFDLSASFQYQAKAYCPPNNTRLLAHVNLSLGTLYSILKDYTYAIDFIDKATYTYKALNDSSGIANAYNARGLVHIYMREYDVAEKFFKDALVINRLRKKEDYIATNINNMALYKGNTEEKIALLHEAIAINKKNESFWSLAENYNNLGVQYTYNKQYNEAFNALDKAYEYAKQVNARDLIRDNLEYRSALYAEKKDFASAYKYRLQYEKQSSDLLNEKRITNIERKAAHQRVLDAEHQKKFQEQEHNAEIWKRNFAIILILVVFLLAAAFFQAKLYRRRKNLEMAEAQAELLSKDKVITDLKLQQQAHELETKTRKLDSVQREITSFVIFANSRNELLEKIRGMIREATKMEHNEAIVQLKKVNTYILQFKRMETENEDMMKEIEEKNNEFIGKLVKRHPDLTNGERKLATLLRINLSSKEISLLTGTSLKAVSMARYRLRKSLELDPKEDVTEYLRNL